MFNNSSSFPTTSVKGSWTFNPSFTLFIIITGSIANIGVLWLYYKRPTLQTPFGIYLINLLCANVIMTCAFEPLLLINYYYSSWTLGYPACVFRQYIGWTILDAVNISHLLIALNRLWAVAFPVSYRTRHTKTLAVKVCSFVWVFLNVSFIPTVIIATYATKPDAVGRRRCAINTASIGIWAPILQLVHYDLPIVTVILLYPIICYKSFFGTKQQRRVHGMDSRQGTNQATKVTAEVVEMATVPNNVESRRRAEITQRRRQQYGSRAGFVTLTLMTLSVVIFLAPEEAYYTLLLVVNTDPPGVYVTVKVLQSLTPVFDPLLIILANPELRQQVGRYLAYFSS